MATSSEAARQAVEYGDQRIERGTGGETHQVAAEGAPRLTTQQGTVVSDDQNTLRAGERGPSALEDFGFREKIFHFDHERIPERVVHARGYGAHGYFENYEPLTEITRADPFSEAGLRTPVFVRFSTVAGNKGSTDLARDVRGFATKFYTREGNWDLVGNNIPVFFIQDAIKFPDIIHAVKAEPDRGFPQAQSAHDNFWDFASLLPESAHMLMWVMSDRAIPRSFRFMEGFGVHTFRLINAEGRSTFVKFHWKPKAGLQSVVWNEALKISGADPDFHRRDLWDAITAGDFPEWELGLQLFDDDFADRFAFDVLDPTKIIPEEQVPVRRVGRMVLDRVVDNFFAETEQVAFCTQNIVPGIDFTNDPLLQGRNFSYLDTQLEEVKSAAEQAEVNVELIAPAVGGVDDSNGNHAPADQKIDGGPSVLYDAVILLVSKHAAAALAALPAARDFVADAFAHCKFIGYSGEAGPLFEAAGLGGLTDDGFVSLAEHSAADFIARCAKLRFWPRQASVAQRAGARQA